MAWEPDYITLTDYKHYLGIKDPDNTDDPELPLDITAASRAVDKCCSERANGLGARRQFGKVDAPEARFYTPRWDTDLLRWVIEIDDIDDVTGLVIAIDTGNDDVYESTITQYVMRPKNALARKRVYTQIAISTLSTVQPTYFPDSAKITGLWGWSTTPVTVKRATLLQAHRFTKRRQSPMGTTGSPQKGSEKQLLENVDPDIEQMLMDYRKLGWTV